MRFKIDSNKVTELGIFLENKSDELDSMYNDVLKIIDRIDENYRSEDSTVYTSRFEDYTKRIINDNKYLKEGGKVLDRTSLLYDNRENEWAKKVTQTDLREEIK